MAGFPVLLRVLSQAEQPVLLEVVAHEVGLHVHDELAGHGVGARHGHAGLGRLGVP